MPSPAKTQVPIALDSSTYIHIYSMLTKVSVSARSLLADSVL